MPASIQPIGPFGRGPGFSSTEQSAGESVSALTAEISMAVETVTANWRNGTVNLTEG